jgi:hypothetical protein
MILIHSSMKNPITLWSSPVTGDPGCPKIANTRNEIMASTKLASENAPYLVQAFSSLATG